MAFVRSRVVTFTSLGNEMRGEGKNGRKKNAFPSFNVDSTEILPTWRFTKPVSIMAKPKVRVYAGIFAGRYDTRENVGVCVLASNRCFVMERLALSDLLLLFFNYISSIAFVTALPRNLVILL